MNPFKILVPLLAIAGTSAYLFRDTVEDKYENLRWSETMRREDPVGYIDFAIGKLEEDKARFAQVRANLASAKQAADARRVEFTEKHAFAIDLGGKMRAAFQAAEMGSGYPVTFQIGASQEDYTREQFVSQVTITLAERDALDEAIDDLTEAMARIATAHTELATRVTTIDASRVQLQTKRAVVEVQQLTSEIEDLMANVEDLIIGNEDAIDELPVEQDPVRSLDEFLKAIQSPDSAGSPAGEIPTTATMQFLEG